MMRILPALAAAAVGGMICAGVAAVGLRVNMTESMPVGFWLVSETAGPLMRGDVVSACLPEDHALEALRRGYLLPGRCPGGVEPVLKTVAALAGDDVHVTPSGIFVNGALASPAGVEADGGGRPMNPVRAGYYVVPEGTMWLLGKRRDAWDSRYFGGVPVDGVNGTAAALLTVPNGE